MNTAVDGYFFTLFIGVFAGGLLSLIWFYWKMMERFDDFKDDFNLSKMAAKDERRIAGCYREQLDDALRMIDKRIKKLEESFENTDENIRAIKLYIDDRKRPDNGAKILFVFNDKLIEGVYIASGDTVAADIEGNGYDEPESYATIIPFSAIGEWRVVEDDK